MNNVYIGIVSEVKGSKARVAVGELTTDYLPILQVANSFKQSFTPIRAGEQCIVLAPYGAINSGVILRGVYSTQYNAPEMSESRESILFEDGTFISYDSTTSTLELDVVKSVIVKCKTISVECESAEVTAKSSVKVVSPSVDLGDVGGSGVVTQQCICALTGLPHPEASKIVRAIK